MEIKVKGIYKHYKTGDYYIVEDIAKNSENLEDMVIYRGLYADGQLWCRPLSMFLEKTSTGEIRFQLQEIASKRIDHK